MSAHRITVTFEEDQYMELSDIAEVERRNLSDLVRDAVTAYLDSERWSDNIGETATRALRDGLSNEEVLERVRAKFPEAKTSIASISWYRAQARKMYSEVPSQARARQFREKRAS